MTRALKWIGLVLAVLLAIVAIVLVWALRSESGARFVLDQVKDALEGKLAIERSSGSLAGPLVLEGVRYTDAAAGIDASIARVSADVGILALLSRRVQVDDVALDGVDVALTTVPPAPEDPEAAPFSLEAPIDIALERLAVRGVTITQDGAPLFTADSLDVAGGWTGSGLVVRELALRAPDGSVDLDGTLATAGGYSGRGQTRFTWRVGEVTYAGTLASASDGSTATLDATLAEPVAATVKATLGQNDALPWTVSVDAPTFDPNRIVPDSGVQTLALALQGSGDKAGGTLTGEVAVDGHHVRLDPLTFTHADEVLGITTLVLRSPEAAGSLTASGEVRYAQTPPSATLAVTWEGVELPADLVGQALATQGRVDVAGSAEQFTAEGALDVGPPGQPSHLTLKLAGTPQAIALETLALVQPKGGLDAKGTVTLQPAIGWQLEATATAFDPGAFAADWKGALDFALATDGRMTDAGPETTIRLDRLAGTLRDRPVSGKADLSIKPEFVVDGTLSLASGRSTVEVRGRGGQQTDATARIDVASLADWLPDAGGTLGADVRVHGKWPNLDVDANAKGQGIAYAGVRTEALELVADVRNLEKPAGALTLDAKGVTQGDARFDTLRVQADGNEASHQLRVDADGAPASLAFDLAGNAKDGRWNGTLKTLQLEPVQPTLPRFDLTDAMALSWDGKRFTAADSCLVGTERRRTPPPSPAAANAEAAIGEDAEQAATAAAEEPVSRSPARLCVGGSGGADGSVSARYRLEHLPLRLITRLAAPDSPVRLRGELAGEGAIERTAAGALSGSATITSAEGSAFYTGSGNQPLLSYTGFAVDAQFAPQSIQASVRASLDHDGRLDGRVTVAGAPGGPQSLDGQVDLAINSLAFLELLTAEVANTKGRVSANYAIGGTLEAPQLTGAITLKEFATEVPVAGLKLRDGDISLRAIDAQRFALEGSITSGEGKLTISGQGGLAEADAMTVAIKGENVLAADIPAARVVVTPDLTVERGATGLLVRGKVTVPKANVDFSKLPGGGVSATSPDIVITDAEREVAGAPSPVTANVTVVFGDDVKLAGFGFDGTVGGQIVVNERPGRATTGTGTLNVGGTYKAYGQDLKIETGRVLFAGTAIDNPGIDLRASRRIEADEVTAGLLVRGTAQIPVLTVFSDPTMEQSEALSYLITGKPLSALKSGEGDMLGTAARALGTAGGDLLAKSIGGRLGVDDIGVADNAVLGGAAFTVGKYLSPKLYLSYGVGIFEPGEVVTLRYLFHKRWNFEAQNATTGSRAGINYRYER